MFYNFFKTFTTALVLSQCTITYMHNYAKGSTFKSIKIKYNLTSVMNIVSIPFKNISSANVFSYVF